MQLVLMDDSFVVLADWRYRYAKNYNNYDYNQ